MKFYHGTNKEKWEIAKKRGYLLHDRATEEYPNMSPCTYLAVAKEEAMQYGEVLLEVEYDPKINPEKNNYYPEGWQVRVYEPIPIASIKILKTKDQ